MKDAGIVRNRAKVEATITNARALVDLLDAEGEGALDRLVWGCAPPPRRAPPTPPRTPRASSAQCARAHSRASSTS